MTIKIYYLPNIQYLTYNTGNNIKVENNPMNRFDTVVFKGSNNTLDFSIRNRDRKPINLLDKTLTIYIKNIETSVNVLSKTLEKLDMEKGFARLVLTEDEIFEWREGFYQYAITVVESNGREGFVYVDQVHRVTGQFELKDNAVVHTAYSIKEITNFLLDEKEPNIDIYRSGAVSFGTGTVHTAAFYLDNFIGVIEVQVTLDQGIPDNENNWAIHSSFNTLNLTSSGVSAIKYFNLEGNYSFVRFVYKPDISNNGTIEKVIYN